MYFKSIRDHEDHHHLINHDSSNFDRDHFQIDEQQQSSDDDDNDEFDPPIVNHIDDDLFQPNTSLGDLPEIKPGKKKNNLTSAALQMNKSYILEFIQNYLDGESFNHVRRLESNPNQNTIDQLLCDVIDNYISDYHEIIKNKELNQRLHGHVFMKKNVKKSNLDLKQFVTDRVMNCFECSLTPDFLDFALMEMNNSEQIEPNALLNPNEEGTSWNSMQYEQDRIMLNTADDIFDDLLLDVVEELNRIEKMRSR
ncbi:hypothetical protein AKO1_004464 [Acrasis kona]|uniref:Uncharacterized protein n=1 Tax=Acrasis kona TaxID=1008807 RepID=A0AAW2YNT4_9EUKA